MSDPIDPDAMLARLAVLDMAAAEHVHARLLAAEEPKAVAELGRTYQRASRSVRQTLGLMARMRREAAADAKVAALEAEAAAEKARRDAERAERAAVRAVRNALADAAERRVRLEYERLDADEIDEELADLVDWLWSDAFAELSEADQLDVLMSHIKARHPPKPKPAPTPPRPKAPASPREQKAPLAQAADAAPPAEAPAPTPEARQQAERPPQAPPPPPLEPPEEPYIPPWERLRPGGALPGGSGY